MSSHVSGSACNPLTSAIFATEDLDLRRGPYPFREGGRRRKARRFSRKAPVERDDREEDRQRM